MRQEFRRTWRLILAVSLLAWGRVAAESLRAIVDDERIVRRGDANNDRTVNISDGLFIIHSLYRGGADPPCRNQADVNADGNVDASDAIHLLHWLFTGSDMPPFPGPQGVACEHNLEPSPHSCEIDPCDPW